VRKFVHGLGPLDFRLTGTEAEAEAPDAPLGAKGAIGAREFAFVVLKLVSFVSGIGLRTVGVGAENWVTGAGAGAAEDGAVEAVPLFSQYLDTISFTFSSLRVIFVV
jgi:hypothetical protein